VRCPARRGGRDGAALLVTLLALLAASALVLGLVLSAGAERAAGSAIVTATRERYLLEAAVEEHIARNLPFGIDAEPPPSEHVQVLEGVEVRVQVVRLSEGEQADGSVVRVFAVVARIGQTGRRALAVLLRDSVSVEALAGDGGPVVTTPRFGWHEIIH
jgi:hypothetical protein